MPARYLIIFAITFLLHPCFCAGQTDSLYLDAIRKADETYDFKWLKAKDDPADKPAFEKAAALYKIALQIKPNEPYPQNRLREIDLILNNFKIKPLYDKLVSKADSLFADDHFEAAELYYARADSLLSTRYTLERLEAVSILQSTMSHPSDSIMFIEHATSFGECSGYCINEFRITEQSTTIVNKSWNNEQPDKRYSRETDERTWKSITGSIDLKTFYKLPHTIGCPDCADGGAEWLIIGTERNTWKVEFEYGAEIKGLTKLLSLVRQMN